MSKRPLLYLAGGMIAAATYLTLQGPQPSNIVPKNTSAPSATPEVRTADKSHAPAVIPKVRTDEHKPFTFDLDDVKKGKIKPEVYLESILATIPPYVDGIKNTDGTTTRAIHGVLYNPSDAEVKKSIEDIFGLDGRVAASMRMYKVQTSDKRPMLRVPELQMPGMEKDLGKKVPQYLVCRPYMFTDSTLRNNDDVRAVMLIMTTAANDLYSGIKTSATNTPEQGDMGGGFIATIVGMRALHATFEDVLPAKRPVSNGFLGTIARDYVELQKHLPSIATTALERSTATAQLQDCANITIEHNGTKIISIRYDVHSVKGERRINE